MDDIKMYLFFNGLLRIYSALATFVAKNDRRAAVAQLHENIKRNKKKRKKINKCTPIEIHINLSGQLICKRSGSLPSPSSLFASWACLFNTFSILRSYIYILYVIV